MPIAILIIVVVLAGGILVYQRWWLPKSEVTTTMSVQEETTNWKNYTNEKYAYELQYPEGWDEQKPGEPPYPGPPEGIEFFSLDADNFCRMAVEASSFSFDSEIDNLRTKDYAETNVKLAGIDAIQLTTTEANAMPVFIYFENQGNFYRITRSWGSTAEIDQKCVNVFNGIITSFKFLEIEKSLSEQACLDSGGEVGEMLCCKSNGDFPNMCLIGSCSCHPDDSHYVKICNCGYGKCFNGEICVSQQ